MGIFVASLDLGQLQDYSALIILEVHGTPSRVVFDQRLDRESPVQVLPVQFMDIRHIERFPLGTKYKQIAQMVTDRVKRVPRPCYFCVDETGVGVSVIESLLNLKPHGITITAGREAIRTAPDKYHVPKRDLIAQAQVRLQNDTLRIAQTLPHAQLLVSEMLAFRVKISATGHDSYEAWREKEHDDLVLAAAMGCWFAEECFRNIHAAIQEALMAAATPQDYTVSII